MALSTMNRLSPPHVVDYPTDASQDEDAHAADHARASDHHPDQLVGWLRPGGHCQAHDKQTEADACPAEKRCEDCRFALRWPRKLVIFHGYHRNTPANRMQITRGRVTKCQRSAA